MTLRDIIDMLARHRSFIFRWAAIGVGMGVLFAVALPPVYQATTTVTVDRIPPVVVLSQQGFNSQSPAILPDNTEPGSRDAQTLVEVAKGVAVRDAALTHLAPIVGMRRAQAALQGVSVQPVYSTTLVRIRVRNRNPQLAAEAANVIAASLIDVDLRDRRHRTTEMRESIEHQFQLAEAELKPSEDALAAFKSEHGDVQLSEQTMSSLTKLAQLQAQLVDVRMQRREADARIAATRNRLAVQAKIAPMRWVPSPLIATLQHDLASEEIELSGLSQQFTPKYPGVITVQAKIQETKRRLAAEMAHSMQPGEYGVDPVYQQLFQQMRQDEVTVAALDARDRALSGAIKQYEAAMKDLPSRVLEQARLARDAKDAEQVHQILSERLHQARVAEASIGSGVHVVDAAKVPQRPMRSRWFGVLVGAVLGVMFGVGGVLAKEQVVDPVKSTDDAERLLDLPVLGSIPRMTMDDRRVCTRPGDPPLPLAAGPARYLLPGPGSSKDAMLAAERRRSQFAEAFRYLRTNLLFTHREPLCSILVTSPGPGEDKETVAANLAVALAQMGQRVWLVEGDLRKPALDDVWAFRDVYQDAPAGLAGYLSEGVPVDQVLVRTAAENLWFLPAGMLPPNPAELLGSARMRAFLEEHADSVDVMIIDAPPVLPVTDAAVVAPFVDGVLLVVNVGTTPREAAAKARQQLEAVGAQVLGVVATGVPVGGIGAYDHYYTEYVGSQPFKAWQLPQGVTGPTESLTGPAMGIAWADKGREIWRRMLARPAVPDSQPSVPSGAGTSDAGNGDSAGSDIGVRESSVQRG